LFNVDGKLEEGVFFLMMDVGRRCPPFFSLLKGEKTEEKALAIGMIASRI